MMFGAGMLAGLLGLGSGAMKVIAMDKLMRIPFKVSTTTSNFMIGVTAAASAGVFFGNGYIHPDLAMPVMLGVLGGSVSGARLLKGARTRTPPAGLCGRDRSAGRRDGVQRTFRRAQMTDERIRRPSEFFFARACCFRRRWWGRARFGTWRRTGRRRCNCTQGFSPLDRAAAGHARRAGAAGGDSGGAVGFSLVAFFLERDYMYVAISSVVLLVLLFSIASALM